ncbi:RES family NAD+ phosphorylase [Dyadobacter chenwenxiniae]|uniref:RES family NAD+ phosphorylase n=1 Tax=Dyadobacter chenwenxiniae TaxID=2906456 RepID=A0A9X1PPH2_9BACT|nr:RES family NAD+ phosphorylase [Dyadobacter chenwenxiniae]MCF0063764.1 RES family NAD+ phosphorylase [Dyadobacter chenwenxiniae]UON83440.1 RES family NAD+ phosphorylase [Dyadobacter chenwenxiniae]
MPERSISNPSSNSQILAYRLVKERFSDTPLSTEGARKYGGRWNPAGIGILYTSASPELALLEQLVHLPSLPYPDLPKLFLITIALPTEPKIFEKLPFDWQKNDNYDVNHQLLANWLTDPDVMALKIPSAVVAESYNFLLHPLHPDYQKIEVISTHPFNIDSRLWRS